LYATIKEGTPYSFKGETELKRRGIKRKKREGATEKTKIPFTKKKEEGSSPTL